MGPGPEKKRNNEMSVRMQIKGDLGFQTTSLCLYYFYYKKLIIMCRIVQAWQRYGLS